MKFEKMSRQEQRIAICEGVIAQCKRLNVKVRAANRYFLVRERPRGCKISDRQECQVCAKGGMMLALLDKKKLKLNFDRSGPFSCLEEEEIVANLNDIFTEDELDVIERLFEGWGIGGKHAFDEYIYEGSENAFSQVKPARKRLIGIMGNIIANGGNLVFSQGPIFHKTVKVSLL